AQDRGPEHLGADPRRVRIQVPDDAQAPLRALREGLREPLRPRPAADDEHPAEALPSPQRPLEVPDGAEADPDEKEEIDRREDRQRRTTDVLDLEQEQDG